ncbi:MAG: hypothetical protein OJF61_000890 [Rhodanobacteraceae bacterium]|jgi:hypothetical protein|nr:MAG: hypothetical protein OJF61_000890 [Rhodanobacteraceae bacterium]
MSAAPEAIPLDPPSQAKGEDKRQPLPTPFGTKGVAQQSRGDESALAGNVLRLADIGFEAPASLLAQHGLELVRVEDGAPIPGSFWGEPEAGVIASTVYARADTPVHSLLHEACHLLVAGPAKRASIHTDASDSLEEEDATCYLQIVLADALPGFGRERALADMDAWGYSFRLGSARAWFEHDADDARAFLEQRGLLPLPT